MTPYRSKGTGIAFLACILLALNMRAAISTLSPIADMIARDIHLTPVSLSALGALPPLAFGVFGILTPRLVRRVGIETATLCGVGAIVLGHIGRGLSPGLIGLFVTSAVVMAGIGVVNVLLPPLVKQYFPRAIPLTLALTSACTSVGTAIPALAVYPISEALGWRAGLIVWGLIATVALPPWIALASKQRRAPRDVSDGAQSTPRVAIRVTRSRIAWALLAAFVVSMTNLYAMFAWLPEVLGDVAEADPEAAGALLAVYASIGFIVSLALGVVAPRMKRNLAALIHVAVGAFIIAYIGLAFAPTTMTWLWVALAGLGPTHMHVCYMLVGMRTRTQEGAVALSSFMQGVGYGVGAVGPVLFGVLGVATDGWRVPLVVFAAGTLIASVAAVLLSGTRMLEDDGAIRTKE